MLTADSGRPKGGLLNALDLFRLDGKTAIVTGGGRGLGRYMAEALADAGANVVLCSRKKESLEEVKGEIEARGGHALALACDVTDPDDVQGVVSEAENAFGGVDVLVNNSGATWGAPPAEMPIEKFDQVMAVNVRGTFLMAQAVGRRMIERGGGGAIVNISAFGAVEPSPDYPVSSTLRAALSAFAKLYARRHAAENIRMNNVLPGFIDSYPETEALVETIPARRFGTVEEIAGAVAFLLSPDAGYITGQDLLVDGGLTRGI